jgi:hypothetical protein
MLRSRSPRSGVAAVELAIVSVGIIVPVLIGIWETGRIIEVKQLVSTAAREGARLAAQGYVIDNNGQTLQVKATTGSPNVSDAVYQSLIASGLTKLQKSDVTTTFRFVPMAGGASPTDDPYLGIRGQAFTVSVSIPWEKVRWVNLGILQPETVSYSVSWRMLIDDKFTVNETLPSW